MKCITKFENHCTKEVWCFSWESLRTPELGFMEGTVSGVEFVPGMGAHCQTGSTAAGEKWDTEDCLKAGVSFSYRNSEHDLRLTKEPFRQLHQKGWKVPDADSQVRIGLKDCTWGIEWCGDGSWLMEAREMEQKVY
jgi:hypothetical protein